MNKEFTSQESNVVTPRPKLFGLPRPWVGAIIGIILFLLVEFIFWTTKLMTAFLILLSPGILTRWIIIPPTIAWSTSNSSRALAYTILAVISAIPPAIFGSLIVSSEKETRSFGITLSIIYFILLLVIGIPISALFD
jgi:hypothetical protein